MFLGFLAQSKRKVGNFQTIRNMVLYIIEIQKVKVFFSLKYKMENGEIFFILG